MKNNKTRQKLPILKKMLKAAGFGLAGLLAVLAGLIIWLRTDSGADFIFGQIQSALAGSGFELSADSLEGPLPGRLSIRNLKMADHIGPVVTVRLVEVEIRTLALLTGTAHVPLIKVEGPELWRLPQTNPSEEEDSGVFSLPVEVRLDKLTVSGGRVRPGALINLGVDNPALDLKAEGFCRLVRTGSALDFSASLAEESGTERAAVALKLDSGDLASDRLKIAVSVNDEPGGLIGAMARIPDWPGLTLNLTGDGPLENWRGNLDLAAGKMGWAGIDLTFRGATGHLWPDLIASPDWRAQISGMIRPGADFPAEARIWTGTETKLTLRAALKGENAGATLSLATRPEQPLELNAQANGRLAPGGGDFKIDAVVEGLLPPDRSPADPSLSLAAALAFDQNVMNVPDFSLTGAGLQLKASLKHDNGEESLTASAQLTMEDDSPWVGEGLILAGLGANDFGGRIHLAADLDWPGPQKTASGLLKLNGRNLRWPSAELDRLLGPEVGLEATLFGGGSSPLKLDLVNLAAGQISLKGEAAYNPADDLGQSELSIDLSGALADLAVLNSELGGRVDLTVKAEGRLSDFKADMALNSPKISTMPGRLTGVELAVSAQGLLVPAAREMGGPDLVGRLNLNVSDSPGGPLELASDWKFGRNGVNLSAVLANLSGRLAGLDLYGDLTAQLGEAAPRLSGSISAQVSQWEELAALTGQPLSGSPADFKAELTDVDGRQSIDFSLHIPGLKLASGGKTALALNQVTAAFKALDLFGQPNLDLNLSLGSGQAGPLVWANGLITAKGDDGAGRLDAKLNRAGMNGLGGGVGDGVSLAGTYDLTGPSLELSGLEVNLAKTGLKLREPIRLTFAPMQKVGPVNMAVKPGGQIKAEADLTPGAMTIKAEVAKLPFSLVKALTGADIPEGEVQSLTVNLVQGPAGPAGDFTLKTILKGKELRHVNPSLDLAGKLSDGPSPALTVQGAIGGGPAWKASGKLSGRLPLAASPDGGFPTVGQNAPIEAKLDFSGPVAPLWKLAGRPDRAVSGQLGLSVEVGGTLAKPLPRGAVYLAGGRFEDSLYGILVNDINLEAHSTPELPLKALLAAKDGRGGGLALSTEISSLDAPALKASGRLSRFSPLHRDDVIVFISGDLAAEGPLDRLNISSDLIMERGELDLKIIQAANSIPVLSISQKDDQLVSSGEGGHRLALKLAVPNQFFIRGYGLESEWKGALHVGGFSSRPSLTGQVSPVRGYFEAFSKEFQFADGDISFNGGTNPNLNLELVNKGPNVEAVIRIGGNARKPALNLSSRPPLPQEEVLAQVLFGKSASEIGRFEALQLASGLREIANFGTDGGVNALGSLRQELGLDVLRVGGTDNDRERRVSDLSGSMGQEKGGLSSPGESQSDAISVEAGKYISDNIYVGVEHSGVGGAAVRVEMELKSNISLEARTSTESSRVGLGWKKDY